VPARDNPWIATRIRRLEYAGLADCVKMIRVAGLLGCLALQIRGRSCWLTGGPAVATVPWPGWSVPVRGTIGHASELYGAVLLNIDTSGSPRFGLRIFFNQVDGVLGLSNTNIR
jgi:hypothetical protein